MAKRKKKTSSRIDVARATLAGAAWAVASWRDWKQGILKEIAVTPKRSDYKALTRALGRKGTVKEKGLFERAYMSKLEELFTHGWEE